MDFVSTTDIFVQRVIRNAITQNDKKELVSTYFQATIFKWLLANQK